MYDRIDEFRMDWEAPPPVERHKVHWVGPSRTKFMLFPRFVLSLCLFLLAGGLYSHSRHWDRHVTNQIKHTETLMEMSVASRLLRHYHAAYDRMPDDPVRYLAGNLRINKPHPRGCDFWGTPYRVEMDPTSKSFLLRSAGPDRKFHTSDDLVQATPFDPEP